MQPSDRKKFAEILNGIALIKPGNAKLSTEALLMWWNVMQDWSIEEFGAAATKLAKDSEFMPNPYHFEQIRLKATELGKHEAWAEALKRCQNHGTQPNDRITRAAMLIGGYRVIGHTMNDQLPFLSKRFMDAYLEVTETETARALLPNAAPIGKLEAKGVMAMLEAKNKADSEGKAA